jgi:hypothetical protein
MPCGNAPRASEKNTMASRLSSCGAELRACAGARACNHGNYPDADANGSARGPEVQHGALLICLARPLLDLMILRRTIRHDELNDRSDFLGAAFERPAWTISHRLHAEQAARQARRERTA